MLLDLCLWFQELLACKMRQAVFNDEIRILKKLPSSDGGIQLNSLPRKVSMMFK